MQMHSNLFLLYIHGCSCQCSVVTPKKINIILYIAISVDLSKACMFDLKKYVGCTKIYNYTSSTAQAGAEVSKIGNL